MRFPFFDIYMGKIRFYSEMFLGRSYCEPSARADLCRFLGVTSLTHVKEVTKKTCQDVSSWISLGIATLQSVTREIKCTFVVLCLNVSYHAWQVGTARFFGYLVGTA